MPAAPAAAAASNEPGNTLSTAYRRAGRRREPVHRRIEGHPEGAPARTRRRIGVEDRRRVVGEAAGEGRERLGPGGGRRDLERERQPVERGGDGGHRGPVVGPGDRDALFVEATDEERHGRRVVGLVAGRGRREWQRAERHDHLAGHAQRCGAGGQQAEPRRGAQQGHGDLGGLLADLLVAVEHDQGVAPRHQVDGPRQRFAALGGGSPDGRGQGGGHPVAARGRQVDHHDAVGEPVGQPRGHVDRQRRLADASGTHDAHHAMAGEANRHRLADVVAADERGQRRRTAARGGLPPGRVEGGVLEEDGGLEAPELGRGLEARPFGEHRRRLPVGAQRVGLAPRPRQGGHEQGPAPLPQRILVDEPAEQGDRPVEVAGSGQRVGQGVLGGAALVVERGSLGRQRRLSLADVGERRTSPEGQRGGEVGGGVARAAGGPGRGRPVGAGADLVDIDRLGVASALLAALVTAVVSPEDVAAGNRVDAHATDAGEQPAQARHVTLEGGARRRRGAVGPQAAGEIVGRLRLLRVERQQRQQVGGMAAEGGDLPVGPGYAHRAEHRHDRPSRHAVSVVVQATIVPTCVDHVA